MEASGPERLGVVNQAQAGSEARIVIQMIEFAEGEDRRRRYSDLHGTMLRQGREGVKCDSVRMKDAMIEFCP